jgi:hypothetical protein
MANQKKPSGIEGFEEVIEMWGGDVEKAKKRARGSGKDDTLSEAHLLYNFLEVEQNRLNIVDQFLTTKLSNMVKFNQCENLTKIQNEKIILVRDELSKKLGRPDSPMNESLGRIFDTIFGLRK